MERKDERAHVRAARAAGRPGRTPDDVVHGKQQRVVVGRDLDQHHAQRHLLHQPEGPAGLPVDQGLHCTLAAARSHAAPHQRGQRARVLDRQVALQQPRAQDLMPGCQGVQRGLQRIRIQGPAQAQRLRQVVGGAVRVHLVQHDHLRLVGRAGHARAALLGAEGRRRDGRHSVIAARAAAQVGGQASNGRRPEQLRRRDARAGRIAHLGHDDAHLSHNGAPGVTLF